MESSKSKPSRAKVNASFRVSSEAKQEFINQAKAAGIPPSQYYEMVVMNAPAYEAERLKFKAEIENLQSILAKSEADHNLKKNSLIKELETVRIQIQNSQSQLKQAFDEIALLKNTEQQQILGKVRDEEKSLQEQSNGEESPGYVTPHDIMVPFF